MGKKKISFEEYAKVRHFVNDMEVYTHAVAQAMTCIALSKKDVKICNKGLAIINKKCRKACDSDKTIIENFHIDNISENKRFDRGIDF